MSKLEETQSTYGRKLKEVISSQEEWVKFLDFASQLTITEKQYEFGFATQVGIYAINPNATHCLLYREWNDKEHDRYTKRGTEGIKVLSMSRGKTSYVSLFDVSQTGIKNKNDIKPLPNYNIDIDVSVLQAELSKRYNTENDGIENQITQIIKSKLDNYGLPSNMYDFLEQSMKYQIFKRYGFEYNENEFSWAFLNDKPSVYDVGTLGKIMNGILFPMESIIENTIEIERGNIYGNENGQNQVGNDRRETSVLGRRGNETLSEVQTERGREVVEDGTTSRRDTVLHNNQQHPRERGAYGEDGGTSKGNVSDNIGTETTQGVPLSELDGVESQKDGLRKRGITGDDTSRGIGGIQDSLRELEESRGNIGGRIDEDEEPNREIFVNEEIVSDELQGELLSGVSEVRETERTPIRSSTERVSIDRQTNDKMVEIRQGISESSGGERLHETSGNKELLAEVSRGNNSTDDSLRLNEETMAVENDNSTAISDLTEEKVKEDLYVGAVIELDDNLWRVTRMSGIMTSFENLDKESVTTSHS